MEDIEVCIDSNVASNTQEEAPVKSSQETLASTVHPGSSDILKTRHSTNSQVSIELLADKVKNGSRLQNSSRSNTETSIKGNAAKKPLIPPEVTKKPSYLSRQDSSRCTSLQLVRLLVSVANLKLKHATF